MLNVTLPDGSVKQVESGATPLHDRGINQPAASPRPRS